MEYTFDEMKIAHEEGKKLEKSIQEQSKSLDAIFDQIIKLNEDKKKDV